MTPRTASPAVRSALIASAARLLAQEGPAALTLRRVASDAGTSTMAVYTHFGGMQELKREVRRRGYAALAGALTTVERTADPLADLIGLCRAYNAYAREQPDLYRAMFLESPLDEADAAECAGTFQTLVAGVQRCLDTGVLAAKEALSFATELWAAGHGVATLELSALLTPEQADGVAEALRTKLLAA